MRTTVRHSGRGRKCLASIEPPIEDAGGEEYVYRRRGINSRIVIGIGIFAVISLYLCLVAVTRVDGVLFPGNEIGFPVVGGIVPGITGGNDQASAQTIDQRINILVMGLDQRLDEPDNEEYRTDSMMVLTIDPYSKTAGVFSIPRDTRVNIPDPNGDGGVYTRTRINEAYEMGQYGVNYPTGYPGGGGQLAMDVVKQNFGIPIDYYVVLNWASFIKIVDNLGGIDVNVPDYVYDPAYTSCQFCDDYYPVEFLPGEQHMDGTTALEYVRIRHSDNDFKRIERQQIVLRAIIAKAESQSLLSVGQMKSLYSTYRDSITTDIPDTQVPGLALLVSQIDSSEGLANIPMVSMADATYPCPASECGDAAELDFNVQKMEELKAEVFSDVQLTTENAKISILNGTNAATLAGDFGEQLKIGGIPSTNITTDENANGLLYHTTVIIDVTGKDEHTVSQIQSALGIPDSSVLKATDPQAISLMSQTAYTGTTSDILVVLGDDATESESGDISVTPTSGG